MNYYPYFNNIPYIASTPAKTSIFGNLLGGIKLSSIINGTQKTLNILNQAIPLIRQAGPILNNAKTMFRVMNEFKRFDINEIQPVVEEVVETKVINTSGPTFFQ